MRDAIKGVVGGGTGVLVAVALKNQAAAGTTSGAASGCLAPDVAERLTHMLARGSSVHVLTVRQITGTGVVGPRR